MVSIAFYGVWSLIRARARLEANINGVWLVVLDFFCRTGLSQKVETSLTDDGIIASDHRPVIGDIIL